MFITTANYPHAKVVFLFLLDSVAGVKKYVFIQQGNGCKESRLWFAAAFVLAMVYLASAGCTISEAASSPELAYAAVWKRR